MPHIVERRKMKRQQFFATPSQVYNIYYTESVPIQQLPSIAQNLTQSFPRLGLSASSMSRPRKTPRSSGLFRRNRNNLREKKFTDSLPYFPEEYHRKQIADFAINQLKVRATELYENQNFESQKSQKQTPFLEYQKNPLPNYGEPIDLGSNIQERYKQCQNYGSDLPNIRMNPNSPRGSPTSVNSSLNSCNRGMLNNSGQVITVPTQPMSSSQGYSMKIEVLAQPLKSEGKDAEKLEENFTDAYEVAEFLRQKSVDLPQNVIAESKCVVPVCEVPIQSKKTIPCIKKKKRMSFFTNIMRRIKHENSQPDVSGCKKPHVYPREIPQPEECASSIKMPLISIAGDQIGERYSTASPPASTNSTSDAKESNKNDFYSAQEILSPRQVISSTTNMCSVKTDPQNMEPVESNNKTIAFENKKATWPGEEIVNVTPSFQDVMAKLEDTLARYRFESDAERKLFANVITDRLKEHGIKLNFYNQFVAEMTEKEKRNKTCRNNTTTIEELSEKESVNFPKCQRPSVAHVHKKLRNQKLPGAHNSTSRSHVSQINEVTNPSENEILPSSPHTNCKSAASSASYICGSCKCRNPPSILVQNEDLYSLKRESARKSIDDDSYSWKALYEHDVVQDTYRMFEANHDNILSAYEDDHIKYQHWLKIRNRDGQPSCEECIDGGTSSRNLKSTECSQNLATSGHHSLSHRRRQREHSPPERDISSKSLHDNNRGYHTSVNPSVSGFEHVYFDPDAEPRRYPPNTNLACCGLVMYGQNESALSLAQGQCCHRTIPVCGTVSQGVSPRYAPNFMPPYHERDQCYSQCSHLRAKIQCARHIRRIKEKRRRYHRHHISEFEGKKEADLEASPNGTIDGGLSPPLMLRSLAKAANTVLATIFGRSSGQPANQERHFQPRNREPRTQDPVVISKSKRLTNDAMRQQHRDEHIKGRALFNSQEN